MAGVAKYSIGRLNSNLTNIIVVGIIIAKQQPKSFSNKKYPNGQSSTERAVFNFTIRDSPQDCINVSRWGTIGPIFQEADTLHIGDVVEIINARVAITEEDSANPFNLVLADDGSIAPYSGPSHNFKSLLHIPNRPAHDYTILAQVDSKEGKEHLPKAANFLVSVIKVEPVQTMSTKDKRELEKQTVRLLDFTASAVPMEIWDVEYISKARNWKPRETVLYIADAKIKWDEYKQCKIISLSSSTVITEDPNVPEAVAIRTYARGIPINLNEILENMSNRIPDLSLIKDQLSIQQINEKIQENETFYAVVNAYFSKLNIDGPGDQVNLRCWHCHSLKRRDEYICENDSCAEKEPVFSASFNILTNLSDRTGTLENVRLSGKAAERVLGVDADEFMEKDEEEITDLKTSLMLEKWDMKIGVQQRDRQKAVVTLLSCEAASPHEASARGIAMT